MPVAPPLPHPTLPEHLAQAVWRGNALGGVAHPVIPSGHAWLDAELPGGGWPCQALTEILVSQNAQAEWRLLGPALAQLTRQGGSVLLIGPPHQPCLPGLAREGLRDDRLVHIDAHTPAERLWATEQALKARCVSAVLSWLPQARAEEIRRLHACAAQHPGPFFVFRLARAQAHASAAPLRVLLSLGAYPHPMQVHILKRRGPMLGRALRLPHWPQGLLPLLPTIRPPHTIPIQHTPPALRPSSLAPHASPVIPHKTPTEAPALVDHHVALDGLATGNAPPAG